MNIAAELVIVAATVAAATLAARALLNRARRSTEIVVRRRESPTERYVRLQREQARAWSEVDR